MKLLPWWLLSVLTISGIAAELPPPIIPAGVGVNIHFVTGQEQDLDQIAAAGFKFIRMDFGWASTESKEGEYNWSEYDQLVSNLDKRGIRALFILDYSNPLFEMSVTNRNPLNGAEHKTIASPQHPESVAAFARWSAAAASHFKGRHVIWEIWNEPNIDFWSPKPDAQQYTTLALATASAIREADPGATIIGPASSGFPWQFLETFLQSGILKCLDAVSVHPYRDARKPPETVEPDYARLRQLIGRYKPSQRPDIQILSGEWGYSSHRKGVTLETQAAFAVREQLVNLLNGVPLSIWYDWKNDGDDPGENEHNFGTVFPDLKPKPAYLSIKTLTRELAGFQVSRRLNLGNEKDYVAIFVSGSAKQMLAAWTTSVTHQVTLHLDRKDAEVISGLTGSGETFSPSIRAEGLVLELGPMPQFIRLGNSKVSEQ